MDKHEILADFKRVASEIGQIPGRADYRDHGKVSDRQINNHFGSFTGLLQAAGMAPSNKPQKEKKFKHIKTKPEPDFLSNHIRIDLDALFAKAGNPEFLSLLAMPDTHREHGDPYALNCFLEYASYLQPHIFLIMGDFLNAGGLTHWPADELSPKRIVPEALLGRETIGLIHGLLNRCVYFGYIEGNHEDWIRQFLLSDSNPQLHDGLEHLGLDITVPKLLDLEKYGIQYFPLNKIVLFGQAGFTHGLYCGKNHAKAHIDAVKHSIFYGHTHDRKCYTDTSLFGPIVAQSLACLCDLNPKFLRGLLNNWEHGFGEFSIFRDGSFIHSVPKISNGKTVINGKLFSA